MARLTDSDTLGSGLAPETCGSDSAAAAEVPGIVKALPVSAALVAGLLGSAVLVGWAIGSRTLTSVLPEMPTMKVNTAFAFLLVAATLMLLRNPTPLRRRVATLAGLVVVLLGVLTLAEGVSGRSLGIDQLVVHDFSRAAGRCSPVTAFAFLLLGFVQLTIDAERQSLRRANLLAGGAFALTVLFAAAGYLYGSSVVTGRGSVTGMAVSTLAGLIVLLAGVAAQRPDRHPLLGLRGPTPDAALLRRLTPAVLIVPPVLGFLRLAGQDAGWYDTRFGLVVFTVSMIVAFAVLVVVNATEIRKHDQDRRRAAEATSESERRFRAVATLAPVGIIETDRSGTVLYANPRACEITGRAPEELLGGSLLEAVHEDDRQTVMAARSAPAAQSGDLAVECRMQRPDGTVAWIAVRRTPIRHRDGRVIGFLGTLSDVTALKSAERAAQDSRAQLQALLDHAPMPMSMCDLKGHFVLINRCGAETMGRTVKEVLHARPEELYDPQMVVEIAKQERMVREGGAAITFETTGPDLAGEDRAYLITKYPVCDGEGRIVGVGGISLDVTDRRRAEVASREAEQRFRLMVEGVQDYAILMLDVNGNIATWNAGAERIKGYRAEEIVGRHFSTFYPPEDLAAGKPARELEVVAADGRMEDEGWRVRKDGTRFWANVVITARRDASGIMRGYSKVTRDLTERRAYELELRASEESFRSTIDHAPIGIALVSTTGHWLHVNKALCAMTGYDAAELLTKTFQDITHPDDLHADMEQLQRVLAGEIGGYAMEKRYFRADGSTMWILLSVSLVRDGSGAPVHFVSQIQDVTERRQMVEALRASREEALEASRLKSEFVANMSHELRTPLNGVVCMSELLLDTDLRAEQREYAEVAMTSAEALMRVINDILDFSKIEAGKLDIVHEDYSIESAVSEVCEIAGVNAHKKNLELAVSIDAAVPSEVRGDHHRVRQVLVNLVGNAVKFTSDGEIVVRVGVGPRVGGEERLHVEVADTGIGIEPDRLAKLFQPFTQADATTTRRYGGSGLGLSIAQQLIEMMGGEIGAHSAPGEGSTFWFTLPCERGRAVTAQPNFKDLTGTRLLIVDDNATNRTIMERQTASWGITADSADGGHSALVRLHRAADAGRPYEVALIDMHMPRMDGLELARAVKTNPRLRSTRLIMLSSWPVPTAEASATGIEAALTKPVRQSRLYDQLVASPEWSRRPARQAPQRHRDPSTTSSGRSVLVAEDNEVNQFAATQVLVKLGFTVDIAANGREAIEMSGEQDYAAVFMDCQMPEIDGYAATQAIRRREANARHTPIIAMTSHTMDGDRAKCLAAGMDDYISKPLRLADVATVCDRIRELGGGTEAPLPAADSLFDPSRLLEFADADQTRELIPMFIEQMTARVAQLVDVIDPADADTVHQIAHGLKGSAATVGATLVADICDRIGEIASRGSTAGTSDLYRQLDAAADETRIVMLAYLQETPAGTPGHGEPARNGPGSDQELGLRHAAPATAGDRRSPA